MIRALILYAMVGYLLYIALADAEAESATRRMTEARAASTYQVIGTSSLVKRSGPAVWYRQVGSLGAGTTVAIGCQFRSSSNVRGSTIWNRLIDGSWISDFFVSTPVYDGFSAGIPRCVDQPAEAVGSTREQRAVAWAKAQVGKTHQSDGRPWNNWCDRFVANAYGVANSGYATAWTHWQALVRRGVARAGSKAVPVGGLAFFANGSAGHVMLSLGGDWFVSTGPKVHYATLGGGYGRYLGWAPANAEWPGRG